MLGHWSIHKWQTYQHQRRQDWRTVALSQNTSSKASPQQFPVSRTHQLMWSQRNLTADTFTMHRKHTIRNIDKTMNESSSWYPQNYKFETINLSSSLLLLRNKTVTANYLSFSDLHNYNRSFTYFTTMNDTISLFLYNMYTETRTIINKCTLHHTVATANFWTVSMFVV